MLSLFLSSRSYSAAYAPDDPRLTPEELRGLDLSVMAVVSYYGVTDLRAYGEHTTARLADGARDGGGMPDEAPEMYDLASPIQHVGATSPPTLLLHGEHDSIVPVASVRRLQQALVAAKVATIYVEFPRTGHAFDALYPPLVGAAGQAALDDLERFLACVARRVTAASSGPSR